MPGDLHAIHGSMVGENRHLPAWTETSVRQLNSKIILSN